MEVIFVVMLWDHNVRRVFPGKGASLVAQTVKNRLHWRGPGFDPWIGMIPRRKKMTTYSSMLAWKIAWTEEPDGLLVQSKSDWATERAHTMPCRSQPSIQQSPGCLFRSLWQEPNLSSLRLERWPILDIRGSWDWLLNIWTARERGSNEKQKHPLCRSHRTIYSGRPHWPQPNVSAVGLYVFFGLERKAVCLMMLCSSHFNWSDNRTTVKEPLSSISVLDYSQQFALAGNGLVLGTHHLQV